MVVHPQKSEQLDGIIRHEAKPILLGDLQRIGRITTLVIQLARHVQLETAIAQH
jgi:hypothetical protein